MHDLKVGKRSSWPIFNEIKVNSVSFSALGKIETPETRTNADQREF